MTNTPKPSWWPPNPYPESIFPMSTEEYVKAVPDPVTRTAISGCVGRFAWQIASDHIFERMVEYRGEFEGDRTKADQAKIEALKWAISMIDQRMAGFRRSLGYRVACGELKVFYAAAIERLEMGEQMESLAFVQNGVDTHTPSV